LELGLALQPWIPNGRTIWIVDAHRGDGIVSLCVRIKSGRHFSNWKRRLDSLDGSPP
jgi:hypothetical protein